MLAAPDCAVEKDPTRKSMIEAKALEYMDRAEALKTSVAACECEAGCLPVRESARLAAYARANSRRASNLPGLCRRSKGCAARSQAGAIGARACEVVHGAIDASVVLHSA